MIGRKVDVKEYLSGEEANSKLNREKQRKIFVGGLPLSVNNGNPFSSEILKSYFQQFGKVIEANIVYNHETMKSRGFGFVIFQDEKTVEDVLSRYEDHHLYNKWVALVLTRSSASLRCSRTRSQATNYHLKRSSLMAI
jgi:RNA recognition motif-containing protein